LNGRMTKRLLTIGMLAGPLVLLVGLTLAMTREGFELQRHGSSMLALGEHGWLQTLNFCITGLLTTALALGIGRALRGQPGGRWVAWLLGAFALMHILVALFPTDPAFGFPPDPGTPPGAPLTDDASFHAIVHSLAGFTGFNALAIACFILAWHFARKSLFWCALSVLTAAAIIMIDIYAMRWELAHAGPERASAQFNFLPMWVLLPLIWGYLSGLAWVMKRRLEVVQ